MRRESAPRRSHRLSRELISVGRSNTRCSCWRFERLLILVRTWQPSCKKPDQAKTVHQPNEHIEVGAHEGKPSDAILQGRPAAEVLIACQEGESRYDQNDAAKDSQRLAQAQPRRRATPLANSAIPLRRVATCTPSIRVFS